jgi:NADH:ubiquinone oxidoreductase subunit F (NADH-binding)
MDILEKIKLAKLVGRGGAGFPVADKWSAVAKAMADKPEGLKKCYVVCNCSEGEPGPKKDGWLVWHYPDRVIDGMRLAIEYLGAEKGFFYLNQEYHKKYRAALEEEIRNAKAPIELFVKPHEAGYIGGEEMTVLNVIEGRRAEPRLRPPYPTTCGLYGCPTLVNNVESFYNVSLANRDEFKGLRYYTIGGDCLYEGVFAFPAEMTVGEILKQTDNFPKYEFFVQVGGDSAGEVWSQKQLDKPAIGAGSIRVYSLSKHKPQELMRQWILFFMKESCGKCTPCREGTYRLAEILEEPKPNWLMVADLLANLNDSAFCGLGTSVAIPVASYIKNVLAAYPESKTNLPLGTKKLITSCFN